MKGIPNEERQRLGALLDHQDQASVMAMIPQFAEAEVGAPVPCRRQRCRSSWACWCSTWSGASIWRSWATFSGLPGHPPAGRGAGQ